MSQTDYQAFMPCQGSIPARHLHEMSWGQALGVLRRAWAGSVGLSLCSNTPPWSAWGRPYTQGRPCTLDAPGWRTPARARTGCAAPGRPPAAAARPAAGTAPAGTTAGTRPGPPCAPSARRRAKPTLTVTVTGLGTKHSCRPKGRLAHGPTVPAAPSHNTRGHSCTFGQLTRVLTRGMV